MAVSRALYFIFVNREKEFTLMKQSIYQKTEKTGFNLFSDSVIDFCHLYLSIEILTYQQRVV